MDALILAVDANTQPGWGKLVAIGVAVAAFWVFTQVHKRYKAVRDGKETNPFSQNAPQGGQDAESQVSTPTDTPEASSRKGVRKWLRKG